MAPWHRNHKDASFPPENPLKIVSLTWNLGSWSSFNHLFSGMSQKTTKLNHQPIFHHFSLNVGFSLMHFEGDFCPHAYFQLMWAFRKYFSTFRKSIWEVKKNSTRSDLCNCEIYWKRAHLSRDIFVKNERCKLLKAGCTVFICHSEATLRAYRSLNKPSGRQRCDKVA